MSMGSCLPRQVPDPDFRGGKCLALAFEAGVCLNMGWEVSQPCQKSVQAMSKPRTLNWGYFLLEFCQTTVLSQQGEWIAVCEPVCPLNLCC